MPTITLGAGIQIGSGIEIGVPGANPSPMAAANIYFPMQTIIGDLADGELVPSLTNYGTDGSTYSATSVPGHAQPTVITVDGHKVLLLNGYSNDQWGYNLANAFTVGTGSLFMVGWDAFGTDYNFQSRCMGFGGQLGSPYQLCFFGYSYLNNASFLFRDTTDGGMTQEGLGVLAGLKAFGIVKTGSTVVYYNNDTTPVTYPSACSGTFGFNTVGYRDYGFRSQPSTGYLGDVAWFDTALSEVDAGAVMTYLKTLYSIV